MHRLTSPSSPSLPPSLPLHCPPSYTTLSPDSRPLGFLFSSLSLDSGPQPDLGNLRGPLENALPWARSLRPSAKMEGHAAGQPCAPCPAHRNTRYHSGRKPNRPTLLLPPQTSQFLLTQIRFLPPSEVSLISAWNSPHAPSSLSQGPSPLPPKRVSVWSYHISGRPEGLPPEGRVRASTHDP